jgi:hypothetical protein
MRDIRLGDDIDDFCVRCKRVMNHAVVSVIAGAPAKVRCRTCHSDHDFRHEQAPPPKVDARKAALFQEVLKKVNPETAAAVEDVVDVPEVELEADDEPLGEAESDGAEPVAAEVEAEAEVEVEVESAPPVVKKAAPKPKAKVKAKGKSKK